MVRPRITKALKGSLGELYYKEFCDQRGWAYISLENIYNTRDSDILFLFYQQIKLMAQTLEIDFGFLYLDLKLFFDAYFAFFNPVRLLIFFCNALSMRSKEAVPT